MKRTGRGLTRVTTSKAIASRNRSAKAKAASTRRPVTGRTASTARGAKGPRVAAGRSGTGSKVTTAVSPVAGVRAAKGTDARGRGGARDAFRPLSPTGASTPRAVPIGSGPAEGEAAPDFRVETGDGKTIALSDFMGKKNVVLYFYPKDMTSGCTAESCAFRDAYAQVRKLGAEILGVSMDGPASHRKFAEKYDLPFPLLADTDKTVSNAYGVYKEKSLYGRKFWGIERSTFLIDRDGRVLKAWRKVKVNGHDRQVLDALAAL